jgi:predicted NAD/FAD-dependent oxidoreductase
MIKEKNRLIDGPTAVIGAGISGCFLASKLAESKQNCIVFDKSRGTGGRMSNRRIGSHTIEHGFSLFTEADKEQLKQLNIDRYMILIIKKKQASAIFVQALK